eukprot:jgi/Chlat1/5569/Chrsp369S00413
MAATSAAAAVAAGRLLCPVLKQAHQRCVSSQAAIRRTQLRASTSLAASVRSRARRQLPGVHYNGLARRPRCAQLRCMSTTEENDGAAGVATGVPAGEADEPAISELLEAVESNDDYAEQMEQWREQQKGQRIELKLGKPAPADSRLDVVYSDTVESELYAQLAQEEVDTEPPEIDYKMTVNLPETSFDLRANSTVREPEIQKWWDESGLYQRLYQNATGEVFTLHDGPPYANGSLHIGHALNKVLKDFINRYQILQGRKVRYVPGWDCHGLPIELKVLQSLKSEEKKNLTPVGIRKKAAEFAQKTVEEQKEQFKRYGILAEWDKPYLTMKPIYEAAEIGVFGKMYANGHIYRGLKPVHWSPSSRTALAEAELEYPDGHTSRSVYVAMQVEMMPEGFPEELKSEDLALAIWTTTPWTIPANAAIAINDRLKYAVVEVSSKTDDEGQVIVDTASWKSQHLIVAEDLVPALACTLRVNLEVKGVVSGSSLTGMQYRHPLFERTSSVVVGGDYITTAAGTGLVHTAPGHGQEDYITGQKYGLPLLSPVGDDGRFTEEAGPFVGKDVLSDGNAAVIDALAESGFLLKEYKYAHKYPYDWRTKKPTIFRATEQWFASVEGFRPAALAAISTVQWIPSQGENRITAMTTSRSDWCISRQRSWGVPIPAFYHKETREPLMNEVTIRHVQDIVREEGADAWWERSVAELLPEPYRSEADMYDKGMDTMDVWFDSGSSWAAVSAQRKNMNVPADLYLEGSDQHRGWFQSSLLTAVATIGVAPYKAVLTHGFVLDEAGKKMSKSLGNVVDPLLVINGGSNQKQQPAYGADCLRLWVASVDYTSDVLIGPGILKQVSESYRKYRNTLRYMLGNLNTYEPLKDKVQYEQLPRMDKYMLCRLSLLMDEVNDAYSKHQFYRLNQALQRFGIVELSNFYFDIAKDRLYTMSAASVGRRSCQTVLAAILSCMLRSLAPITPHMAEDAWQKLPFPGGQFDGQDRPTPDSIFEAGWAEVPEQWQALPQSELEFFSKLKTVRERVLKVLDLAREAKMIGASLEARVFVHVADADLLQQLKSMTSTAGGGNQVDELRYIFITSQASIVDSSDEVSAKCPEFCRTDEVEGVGAVTVGVAKAEGQKCKRCWNYSPKVGSVWEHYWLCERCLPFVTVRGRDPLMARPELQSTAAK